MNFKPFQRKPFICLVGAHKASNKDRLWQLDASRFQEATTVCSRTSLDSFNKNEYWNLRLVIIIVIIILGSAEDLLVDTIIGPLQLTVVHTHIINPKQIYNLFISIYI